MLQEFNSNQKANLAGNGQYAVSENIACWRTWTSSRWADRYF
ncbi:Trp operon leader peptide [Vibrio pectenicida]|uniref:Trp operon leader peptide n=1 Tax=Vibrio pectenicida TaxID=62763 RepID=A0A7Y4A347_9VIBR|nr:Trp operon leader peptide [Vibrio pectenicida]NOH73004.1 Trp operon leader peptide [Vibrio pectenicida]